MAAVSPFVVMGEFKTQACRESHDGTPVSSHDPRSCPFFHNHRDRRRRVIEGHGRRPGSFYNYEAEPCPEQFDDSRVCPRGDNCGFCHNMTELLYHPDFFKKRLCGNCSPSNDCPRGAAFCAFAHSREELLVPHFTEEEEENPTEEFIAYRFKTQWCPIGGPHDWERCVYAHTYRDWRRTPHAGYSSKPCPHWTSSLKAGKNPSLQYGQRCPLGMACHLAHGAKEQLYHPSFYKTMPCSEKRCERGVFCAFTHGEQQIRNLGAPEGGFPMSMMGDESEEVDKDCEGKE